ncbi:rifin, partial [Plasmodium reichenowi]
AHNNNNEQYIIPHHTPKYTSRLLSECDIQSSIHDNDEDIKSVKENFHRQTSQRFEEYEERMKVKRQKHREERDKNIQKIIDTDKREKSLAEKIEKGCLKCGCGLGGVAASVGVFGGLGIYGSEMAATAAGAKAAGADAGVQTLISGINDGLGLKELHNASLAKFITIETYNDVDLISKGVIAFYESFSEAELTSEKYILLSGYQIMEKAERDKLLVQLAKSSVAEAVDKASKETIRFTTTETSAASTQLYSAIGYSVLAILIVVLVMIIIYLVLRYRRKKKMKKKDQYTKLLNQ